MDLRWITTKKKVKILGGILLLALVSNGPRHYQANAAPQPDPVPNAEANAEALPEALPEADAQYDANQPVISPMPNRISTRDQPVISALPGRRPDLISPINPGYPGVRPTNGQGRRPNACELSNRCCGLAEQCYGYAGQCGQPQPQPQPDPRPPNPIVDGKRCFQKWVQVCLGKEDDRVRCIVKVKRHCQKIRAKDCRIVSTVVEREFQTERCIPKPLYKCFRYQSNTCGRVRRPQRQTITWTNDKLHKVSSNITRHCLDVQSFNCSDVVKEVEVKEQKMKTRMVPDTRRVCRRVRVPSPFIAPIVRNITRTVWRMQCDNIPVRPTCSQARCVIGGGYCGPSQFPCSLNEFNTTSFCPFANQGNQGRIPGRRPDFQPGVFRSKRDAQYDSFQNYGGSVGEPMADNFGRPDYRPEPPLGPGGIRPIQPLGPGGVQPLQPLGPGGIRPILGPGGIQPIRPLGPGGIQPIRPQPLGPGGQNLFPGGRTPCQQFRRPICAGQIGGACVAGMQQCCGQTQKTRRVCRRVPQQIVEQVTMPVPPSPIREKTVCEMVTSEKREVYYEPITTLKNVTYKDCKPVTSEVCHNLNVPKYVVVAEKKSDYITLMVDSCQRRPVWKQYCHTFPAADVECRAHTVKRQYRLNKIVCDKDTMQDYCYPIPYTHCEKDDGGNKCRMVPKEVCVDVPSNIVQPDRPKCDQNSACMTCDRFRQGNGFAACNTNRCPSWIGPDDGILGNDTNGGFYPNNGGNGGFFPDGQGGNGGFFPDGQGGNGGFFPDGQGGNGGFFPGGNPGRPGGDGYYPGRPDFGGNDGSFYPGRDGNDWNEGVNIPGAIPGINPYDPPNRFLSSLNAENPAEDNLASLIDDNDLRGIDNLVDESLADKSVNV